MVRTLQTQVDALQANQNTDWLAEHRSREIRNLVDDMLTDADTRASLQSGVTSGYAGGFFITSADDAYALKINGQLQSRWLFNRASDLSDQHGFEQRRTKLKFSGHVVDRSWTYKLTVAINRSSGQAFAEDAFIQKTLDNGWSLRFGQFKAPFLREEWVSSTRQLAVERSMVNNAFTYGWTQGLALGYAGDQFTFDLWYGDGPNRSNTASLGDSITSVAGRVQLLLAGAWGQFKGFNAMPSGDFGAMLGVGMAYVDASDLGATIEIGNAAVTTSTSWTIDLTLAAANWQIFASYVHASGKDDISVADSDSTGYVLQGGYLVADDVELFGRYEGGKINGYTPSTHDALSVVTVGINYWPTGTKALKWTTDVGYAFDALADGAGGGSTSGDWTSTGNGWREDAAGQDGQLLLRTQLQILF